MAPTTQAAFARRHGVSKKTVTVWKRQGRVVMVGSLVDAAASDALLQGSGHGRFRRSAASIPLPPDKRRAVDWAALAEDAGGVFDRAACEAHLAATYGVMRDTTASTSRRDRMAALAAPFCHARATDAALGKKAERQEQADEASSSGRFAVRPSPHLTAGKKAMAQTAADTAGHGTGWGSDLDTAH